MAERYYQHVFENGLALLGEKMPGMQSAAMTMLVPAGAAFDPRDGSGTATVLSDLILRGAGSRDSRQLTDYLDRLGLQRSSSVGVYHARFACAALAAKVMESLPAYADIIRRPHLPNDGFEAARDLALQGLASLEDDPRQKLLIKLREWHFPWPFGRSTMGNEEQLQKLTLDLCKLHHARRHHARGAIISLAGNIDFERAKDEIARQFGDWNGAPDLDVETIAPPGRTFHQDHQSEQTHIGIAYPSIEETHADYYTMRLAIEALSGGMSSRLFTEIREKRGLVYNVWAGYTSLKGSGSILGYAGTSNDRAQATIDTFIEELHRLSDGITASELDRAKTGLKAATIMQGESTSSRASSIAHDYFMRGRIRTLDEVKAGIDEVTLDRVNDWLGRNKPADFTIVTVGPKELKLPATSTK